MADVLQKTADSYKSIGHLDPKGFDEHIVFHAYPPPARLAPFVDHFWHIRWDRAADQPYVSEQVMDRPYVDVYISKDDSGIQCAFRNKKEYKAADSGRIIGVRFLPGAFHAFWHWSMAGLNDKTLPIAQVFPEADEAFIAGILAMDDETARVAMTELILTKNPQPDPNIALVNEIIAAVEQSSSPTVKDIARTFGKSERWLQQLFQDYVGIGIKWLVQRNRLLEAAKSIRETEKPDWTALAYELEYSSQQHFITDFKRVTGKTPAQYKRAGYASRQTDS